MLRVSLMKKQEKPGGCEVAYSMRMKRKEVRRAETETVGRRRRREYRREKRKRRKEQRKDWGGAEEMRWLQVPGSLGGPGQRAVGGDLPLPAEVTSGGAGSGEIWGWRDFQCLRL